MNIFIDYNLKIIMFIATLEILWCNKIYYVLRAVPRNKLERCF